MRQKWPKLISRPSLRAMSRRCCWTTPKTPTWTGWAARSRRYASVAQLAEDVQRYLDGRYRGKAAIREVWKKWASANDGKPRQARLGNIEQYANPKGVALQASAEYVGKTSVKVWHVLVYRDGQLATDH